MSGITKPPVLPAWADTAVPTTDIVQPSNAAISAGWPLSSTPPPRQTFNWLDNFLANGIRYFCRRGLVDYDAAETYLVGDIVRGDDGLLRRSSVNANIGNLPSTHPSAWGSLTTVTPTGTDNSTNIATTAFVSANYLPKATAFSAISGQVSAAQVPLPAVQQYQGALSIAFGQLSGTAFNSQIPLSAVQQYQGNLTISFGQLSGSAANAQIPLSAVQQYQGSLTIAFTQLSGQASAGQIPLGAVQQYQASLSIAWGQLTGVKNADQVGGFAVTTNPTPNTVVARDVNGYVAGVYFSQGSAVENFTISSVMANSGDNFLRKITPTNFGRQIKCQNVGGLASTSVVIGADPGGVPAGSPGDMFLYY